MFTYETAKDYGIVPLEVLEYAIDYAQFMARSYDYEKVRNEWINEFTNMIEKLEVDLNDEEMTEERGGEITAQTYLKYVNGEIHLFYWFA